MNKAQIQEAVDNSLARLQTDCIDLYQIHWPERYVPSFGAFKYDPSQRREDSVPFEEQLEAMQSIIDQGKVRHVSQAFKQTDERSLFASRIRVVLPVCTKHTQT